VAGRCCEPSCVVLRANTAAMDMFGEALGGEMPQLLAIWSPENGGMPEGVFRAVAASNPPDGEFEISRGERHNGEIHSRSLHV